MIVIIYIIGKTGEVLVAILKSGALWQMGENLDIKIFSLDL
jgi:hypothetical protein